MLSLSLLVTAGALAAVNGIVYLNKKVAKNQNGNAVVLDDNTTIYTKDPTFKNIPKQYVYLDKKTDMVHKKLQKMEQHLNSIRINGNGNGNDNLKADYDIYKKVERLEDFKRNTEIEIRALKDLLEENWQMPVNKQTKHQVLDKSVEDKIRALAFNSDRKR